MNKFLLILILFIVPLFVFSDEAKSNDFTYVFHLYYDNGQLFADRDFEFKYDVIPETFVSETLDTQFPHKGEVVNFNNQVAFTFQFDPRQGNPNFLKGVLSVKAPYLPDGQKVVFYNNQGDALLTIFVQDSSFCNDDGVCNSDTGEDSKTCPNDCKTATPVPTTITTGPSAGGGMLKILIYLIIGLGLAVGGWYGWKWWKGRQAGQEPPPTITQFPQNPNVQ